MYQHDHGSSRYLLTMEFSMNLERIAMLIAKFFYSFPAILIIATKQSETETIKPTDYLTISISYMCPHDEHINVP